MIFNLKTPDFILASASPRRQELFSLLELNFKVQPSDVEEIHDESISPEELVQSLSLQKAQDVADKVSENLAVVGADTIVLLENEVLGKPKDKAEAQKMLRSLSGKTHKVFTGFTILHKTQKIEVSEAVATEVKFKELSDLEIESYVKTKEPMDKAGAYGIQGFGSILVEKVNGCYFNVMGFPLNRFYEALKKIYV
ncbi:MAG: septum formation inhibitor Maf [Calditrichaeota bacterium]|nr:MAG: septum formation inhibitor Maf [Calditrichota bacterium]